MDSSFQCVFCKCCYDSQAALLKHKYRCPMAIKKEPPDDDGCSGKKSQTSNVDGKGSVVSEDFKLKIPTTSVSPEKDEVVLKILSAMSSEEVKCDLKNEGPPPPLVNALGVVKTRLRGRGRPLGSGRGRGRGRGRPSHIRNHDPTQNSVFQNMNACGWNSNQGMQSGHRIDQLKLTNTQSGYQYIQPQPASTVGSNQISGLCSSNSGLLQSSSIQAPMMQSFTPNMFGPTQYFSPALSPVKGMVGSQFNMGGSQPILQSNPTAASAINLFPQIQNLNMNLQLPVSHFPQNSLINYNIPVTSNSTVNGLTSTISHTQPVTQGNMEVFPTNSKVTASSTASSVSCPTHFPILLGNQIIVVGGDQLSFNSSQPKIAFTNNGPSFILPKPAVSNLNNNLAANTTTCVPSQTPVISSVRSLFEQSLSQNLESSSAATNIQSSKGKQPEPTVKDLLNSKKLKEKQEQEKLVSSVPDQKPQYQTQAIDLTVTKPSPSDSETHIICLDLSSSPDEQEQALDLSKKETFKPSMSSPTTSKCTGASDNKKTVSVLQGIQDNNSKASSDTNPVLKRHLIDGDQATKDEKLSIWDNMKISLSANNTPTANSAQLPSKLLLQPQNNNTIGPMPPLLRTADNTVINLQFSNSGITLPNFINNVRPSLLMNNSQAEQNMLLQNLVNNQANMIGGGFYPNSIILGPSSVIQPSVVPNAILPTMPSLTRPVAMTPFQQDSLTMIPPPSTTPALLSSGSMSATQMTNLPTQMPPNLIQGSFQVPLQSNSTLLPAAQMMLQSINSINIPPVSSKSIQISSRLNSSSVLSNKESTSLVTFTQAPIFSTSVQSSSSSSMSGQHRQPGRKERLLLSLKTKRISDSPESDSEVKIIDVSSEAEGTDLDLDRLRKTSASDLQANNSNQGKNQTTCLKNHTTCLKNQTTCLKNQTTCLKNQTTCLKNQEVFKDDDPESKRMLVGPFTQESLNKILTDPSLLQNYVSISGNVVVNSNPIAIQSSPKTSVSSSALSQRSQPNMSILPKPAPPPPPVVLMRPYDLGSGSSVPLSIQDFSPNLVPNTAIIPCQYNSTNMPFTDLTSGQYNSTNMPFTAQTAGQPNSTNMPFTSLSSVQCNSTNMPFTSLPSGQPNSIIMPSIISSTPNSKQSPIYIPDSPPPDPDRNAHMDDNESADQDLVKVSVSFKALESDCPVDVVLSLKDVPELVPKPVPGLVPEVEQSSGTNSFQYTLDKVPKESSYWKETSSISADKKPRKTKKKYLSAKRREALQREIIERKFEKNNDRIHIHKLGESGHSCLNFVGDINLLTSALRKSFVHVERLVIDEKKIEDAMKYYINKTGTISRPEARLGVPSNKNLKVNRKRKKKRSGSSNKKECKKRYEIKSFKEYGPPSCDQTAVDENPMPLLTTEENSSKKPYQVRDFVQVLPPNLKNEKIRSIRLYHETATDEHSKEYFAPNLHAEACKDSDVSPIQPEVQVQNIFQECEGTRRSHRISQKPKLDYSVLEKQTFNELEDELGYSDSDFETDQNENFEIVVEHEDDEYDEGEMVEEVKDEIEIVEEVKEEREMVVEHRDEREMVVERKDEGEMVVEREDERDMVVERKDEREMVVERKDEREMVVERKDEGEMVVERKDEGEMIVQRKDEGKMIVQHTDEEYDKREILEGEMIGEHEEDEEYDEIIIYNKPQSGGQMYGYPDNFSFGEPQPIRESTTAADSLATDLSSSMSLQPGSAICSNTTGKEDDSEPTLQIDLSADTSSLTAGHEENQSMYYSSESESDIFEEGIPDVEAEKKKIMRKRQKEVMNFLLKQAANFSSEEEGDTDWYQCNICTFYKTNGVFSMAKHLKKHLSGKLKCELCKVEFCNDKYLIDHQSSDQCGS